MSKVAAEFSALLALADDVRAAGVTVAKAADLQATVADLTVAVGKAQREHAAAVASAGAARAEAAATITAQKAACAKFCDGLRVQADQDLQEIGARAQASIDAANKAVAVQTAELEGLTQKSAALRGIVTSLEKRQETLQAIIKELKDKVERVG